MRKNRAFSPLPFSRAKKTDNRDLQQAEGAKNHPPCRASYSRGFWMISMVMMIVRTGFMRSFEYIDIFLTRRPLLPVVSTVA
jgi:predicted MFS family arabinose efflux permease